MKQAIYSWILTQQIRTEHLLCARHCVGPGGNERTVQVPSLLECTPSFTGSIKERTSPYPEPYAHSVPKSNSLDT